MKLFILLILFILFLLSLIKINNIEYFDSGSNNIVIDKVPFEKSEPECKDVFKNNNTVKKYLKGVNQSLEKTRTLLEFVALLFGIIKDLTLKLNNKYDKLVNINNILLNHIQKLTEEGQYIPLSISIKEIPEDKNSLKYTDLDIVLEGNRIFSMENYINELEISVTENTTKLIGSGYNSLISDIKYGYKVEKVKDIDIVTAMYNNFILIYTKCNNLSSSIETKFKNIGMESTTEEFSSNDIKMLKITKKSNKFKLKHIATAKMVIEIWKSICKLSKKMDFGIKKFEDEIKNI